MTETTPGEDRHRREVLTWRRWRENRLRDPGSWLTLVGLFWLEEGENRFGTGEADVVRLPAGAGPAGMGRFVRSGEAVRVEVDPGIPLRHESAVIAEMALSSDAEGQPTILRLGSLSLHLIARSGRVAVRVRDHESRRLRQFAGLDWYPIDPGSAREARFQPFPSPRTMLVPNFIGEPLDRESPGSVSFDVAGAEHCLDAFTGSKGRLFLVFGDATNGHGTYGGGRFLYTEPPAEGGRVILDFNKAYNPPCVFTPHAACPLPPAQNRLGIAIAAGEKMYPGVSGA